MWAETSEGEGTMYTWALLGEKEGVLWEGREGGRVSGEWLK